jgi:hypothetical protein
MRNFLVKKTVMMEAAPKNSEAFKCTSPFRKLFTEAMRLVEPTMKRE